MPNSTTLHVSLYNPPSLSADAPAESDATTDSEDEHTLTAFGDVSEEQIIRSPHRPLNRLRLKVRRPSFPMKRTSLQEGQFDLKSPAGKFLKNKLLISSPSPLSPSFFVDALKNSLRSGKRRATQRSQLDAVEPETGPHVTASTEPRERTSSSSSASYDCESGQPVILKAVPSVAEAPEPAKGWRKLPPRLPIPKWDVDD